MIKALFLDMDETLCDTKHANDTAIVKLEAALNEKFAGKINAKAFSEHYLKCVYKQWTDAEREIYTPLLAELGEQAFRVRLVADILTQQGVEFADTDPEELQNLFESSRMAAFDFYPSIKACMPKLREQFTLVVITNGPEFSQLPKLASVGMENYVDHIIVGGQEPEEKPAVSIFEKALGLAGCEKHEVVHFGDQLKTDILGAQNSGITSVWVKHDQSFDEAVGAKPNYTVEHPDEMPALIAEIAQERAEVASV